MFRTILDCLNFMTTFIQGVSKPSGIGFVARSEQGNFFVTFGDRTEKSDLKAPGASKLWSDWSSHFHFNQAPHNILTLPSERPIDPSDANSGNTRELRIPGVATKTGDVYIVSIDEYSTACICQCVYKMCFPHSVFSEEDATKFKSIILNLVDINGKEDKKARANYAIALINSIRDQPGWIKRIVGFSSMLTEFTQRIEGNSRPYRLCEVVVGGIKSEASALQTFHEEAQQEFQMSVENLNNATYCGCAEYTSLRNRKTSYTATWFLDNVVESTHLLNYITQKSVLNNICNWSCPLPVYKFFTGTIEMFPGLNIKVMDNIKENRETTTGHWIGLEQIGMLDTKSSLIMKHVRSVIGKNTGVV